MTAGQLELIKDPTLAEIVRRLVAEFRPSRIILFGSRAREQGVSGSDYDVLIVLPVMDQPSFRFVQRAHRVALSGVRAPVDVVVITEKDFQERKTVIGSLPETAVHEGKELYAA